LKQLHIIALDIVHSIRKTVIDAPKSSAHRGSFREGPLYYARKISPSRGLTRLARRLQSWHINCDSVDLAKG